MQAQVAYMGSQKCYIRLDVTDAKIHLAYVSASVWRNKETSKIVVGDNVTVKRIESQVPGDDTANFRVIERLPRRNLFQRSNEDGDKVKELAANVDQLVVVCSFGLPPFSSIVLDRVLVAATHANIAPVIVLNKLDLVEAREFEAISSTYQAAKFTIIGTSVVDRRGLDELVARLEGKTSALYGITGAGKSSLVNAVTNLNIRTGEVSEAIRSGRHTTSSSRLYALSPTTAIIDTPGVRSFRPHNIQPRDVVLGFPEFLSVSGGCAHKSCLHLHEALDACAVKRAVRDKTIATQRYTSFLHMMLELET